MKRSLASLRELLRHFARRQRMLLIPLVLVLALAFVLLALTSGVAYVAPFVYALF